MSAGPEKAQPGTLPEFIDWAAAQKQPQDWQVDGWKQALCWFFRAGYARLLPLGPRSITAGGEARSEAAAVADAGPTPGHSEMRRRWGDRGATGQSR